MSRIGRAEKTGNGPVDKRTRKRLEILRSAAVAFRHRGYHGASVGAIARALHMTKGNLYYYFKNKEEILYFCHDYSLDLLLNELKKVEAGNDAPEIKLRKLIVTFVQMIIDELHGTALTLDLEALSPAKLRKIIARRDKFDQGLRRIIETGIEQGVFRPVESKLISFAILGSMNWIPRWFDPRGPAQSEQIGTVFADYLISGLRKPENIHT